MPKRKKSNTSPLNTLNIVVVESHHHVLEHIHAHLRRSSWLSHSTGWSLWHWDAHADLAVPQEIPAQACFRPQDYQLYETLDLRSTGMAEWILPLVLAAGLTEMCWMQPPLRRRSSTFAPGEYSIPVGVVFDSLTRDAGTDADADANAENVPISFVDLPQDARVMVNCPHPYYLDDLDIPSTVIDEEERKMCMTQTLQLQVSQEFTPKEIPQQPWLLDVCLDYFGANNPYLVELDDLCPAIVPLLQHVGDFQPDMGDSNTRGRALEYQTRLQSWRHTLQCLVEACGEDHKDIDRLVDELLQHSLQDNASEARQGLLRLCAGLRFSSLQIRKLVVEAIPHLSMPHRDARVSMNDFVSSTRGVLSTNPRPFLVTVARSSLEGFTPIQDVEDLQNSVISHIHSIFCGCQARSATEYKWTPEGNDISCDVHITFDYGQWEGSTVPGIISPT